VIAHNRMVPTAVWLIGLTLFACGVKGPPVPPGQPAIPAVVNLSHEISGATVSLRWALEKPLSGTDADDGAFVLYRSRNPIGSDFCEDCPQLFEKAMTIPYVEQASGRYETNALLEYGYRYLFKVRLQTPSGIGPDSNLVRFDFPSDDDSGEATAQ
jgi:hypothetical protein